MGKDMVYLMTFELLVLFCGIFLCVCVCVCVFLFCLLFFFCLFSLFFLFFLGGGVLFFFFLLHVKKYYYRRINKKINLTYENQSDCQSTGVAHQLTVTFLLFPPFL
jgi:uncharacterized membrane protein